MSQPEAIERPWSREDLLTVPALAVRLGMGEDVVRDWAKRHNLVRELPGLAGVGRGRVRWGDVLDLHAGLRQAPPRRRGSVDYLDPER